LKLKGVFSWEHMIDTQKKYLQQAL
jgi:hypothetical protein